jgi:hypothetical protein
MTNSHFGADPHFWGLSGTLFRLEEDQSAWVNRDGGAPDGLRLALTGYGVPV